jgi:hypothetical protein
MKYTYARYEYDGIYVTFDPNLLNKGIDVTHIV